MRPDSSPVAGAIVLAVRDGRDSLKTITNGTGGFAFATSGAGKFSLVVFRIGYRPQPGPEVELASGERRTVRIVTTSEAVQLPSVSAVRERGCRTRSEGGTVVAQVWEEARKALEASILAADAGPLSGQWLEHRGVLAPDLSVVREQSIRLREQLTQQVFRSVEPAELARRGFIAQEADTLAYFAPDQRVLLSSEFAASHCFSLESAAADSLIGIAFSPREQPAAGYTDITGVLWVARRSAELRRLDFEYVGAIESAAIPQRSGVVHFAALGDGRWVVTGWRARVPLFSVRSSRTLLGATPVARRDTVVRAVMESGGDALTLTSGAPTSGASTTGASTSGAQTLFRRAAPTALLQLTSSASGPSVQGASVLVTGTNVVSHVDSSGLARIGPLPAGRYVASVRLPAYDTLGIEPLSLTVRAALTPAVDTLQLPPVSSLLGRLCGDDAERGVLLRGTVRTPDGERVRGARIIVSYLRTDPRQIRHGTFELKPEVAKTSSDVLGDWRLCGMPRGTDIVLAVDGPDGGAVRERFRIDPARMSLRRDVVLLPAGTVGSSLGFDGPTPTVESSTNIALAGRSAIGEFDSRHQRGEATQSLSRSQIMDRHFVQTWQVVAGLRGVRVLQTSAGAFALSGRGNLPSLRSLGAACPYAIVLDGIPLVARNVNGVDLNELPPPERLHGIEVYAGGTRLPAVFATLPGGSFCGVVGVWTAR